MYFKINSFLNVTRVNSFSDTGGRFNHLQNRICILTTKIMNIKFSNTSDTTNLKFKRNTIEKKSFITFNYILMLVEKKFKRIREKANVQKKRKNTNS